MDLKAAAKCTIEQDTGLVVDETSNKLPAKSMVLCKMTPFIITEDGDIDYFMGGKMETVFQAEDECFEFLEEQVRELQVDKSQGFISSIFRVLTGSRYKIREKDQVTSISPMPVTSGSATPVSGPDAQTTTVLPAQVETTQTHQHPYPL